MAKADNRSLSNYILTVAEMPELDNIETLRELEHELDKIDLGWWTLIIE